MSDFLLLFAGLLVGSVAAFAILFPRLRASRATARLLEAQLTAVKQERLALEADLAASQEAAEARDREIEAENAELRKRMDELADQLMTRGFDKP